MPLVSLLIPVEMALDIRPHDLQHRQRRPPVEPDGLPEEGPVPAAINLPERDSMPDDNIRMALAVRQCFARGGLLSESVEHAVHEADIEPEYGEFRSAVRVHEADRLGESRTNLVFGNHHDVPSVLLHMLDDRQVHAVRFAPVAVVMTEDTAALERIISHVRRVRGEPSRRATGGLSPSQSNGAITLRDGSPRSVPEPRLALAQLLWTRSNGCRLSEKDSSAESGVSTLGRSGSARVSAGCGAVAERSIAIAVGEVPPTATDGDGADLLPAVSRVQIPSAPQPTRTWCNGRTGRFTPDPEKLRQSQSRVVAQLLWSYPDRACACLGQGRSICRFSGLAGLGR